MLEPWNDASIRAPPVHTCQCKVVNFDIQDLTYTCKDMYRTLSKQSPLHQEAAILSRLIYKYDKKFRSDIGYRNLKKVNTGLRRYLQINLLKDVDNFISVLPSDDELYLPTRQMLEYLLVRVQTFSKIMVRIYVTSKQAAVFYLDRIKRSESHWMSLMPYAVLCRISSITSVIINHSCVWYNNLIKYCQHLLVKGLPFLPENYQLPSNLKEWLEVTSLDEMGRYNWSENKYIKVLPSLEAIEDTDKTFDIFQYVNDINNTNTEENAPEIIENTSTHSRNEKLGDPVSRDSLKLISDIKNEWTKPKESSLLPKHSIDLGKAISRESLKNISTKVDTNKLSLNKEINVKTQANVIQNDQKSSHAIETVTCTKSLKTFLDNEEKYRTNNNRLSLTKHLSFMQWHALKNNLVTLCEQVDNKRKIQKRFMKVWREKCLELE